MKKVLFGLMALSMTAMTYGKEISNEPVKVVSSDRGLIYLVDDFGELRTMPTFSLGAPSGLASGYGGVFFAASGTSDKKDTDGGIAFGMGYGNPDKIGGAVSMSVGSIDPKDGGAGNRGSLNISAGHNFNDYLLGVSVGVNEIDMWHADHSEKEDPSLYVAATKLLPNEIAPVTVSVGFGNNNFAKVNETGDKKDSIYGFASVAAYVHPQLSLVLDYTSDITTVGVGVVPFPEYPVSFSFAAYDVTKERNEDMTSFIGTVAFGFSL